MHDLEYLMPVSRDCRVDCDLCDHIGCRNSYNRRHEDFLRALDRAQSAGFTAILFPFHFLNWLERDWALTEMAKRSLNVRARIRLTDAAAFEPDIKSLRGFGVNFEWMVDARRPAAVSNPKAWRSADLEKDRFTLVVLKGHETEDCLTEIPPNIREKIRFYFPIPTDTQSTHLTPYEIYKLNRILAIRFPSVRFLPPDAYEIWEPRAPDDFGFEATYPLTIDRTQSSNKPRISVVIPTYNNRDYLLATLDHLVDQNLCREDFEVTVVDDGSSDGTTEAIKAWLEQIPHDFNFKLLGFPRKTARQMGDGFYRAGVARNLGAKYCRGEFISFLDSDILTPPHYLQDLLDRHQRADVIQSVRLNLKEAVSSRWTRYSELDPYRHTEPFEGRYWLDFYSEPNWSDLPYYWKYTCTYGLSLSQEAFRKVGRIRRTFIYYGFEDTDLGYRLAQMGMKFELSDAITYHLFHTTARSEFRNSAEERHRILTKTATIFYLNQLDGKIFSHFHGFFNSPPVPEVKSGAAQ